MELDLGYPEAPDESENGPSGVADAKTGRKRRGGPGPSLRGAINAKCKDCIWDEAEPGGPSHQIETCTVSRCPLWEVRPIRQQGRDWVPWSNAVREAVRRNARGQIEESEIDAWERDPRNPDALPQAFRPKDRRL